MLFPYYTAFAVFELNLWIFKLCPPNHSLGSFRPSSLLVFQATKEEDRNERKAGSVLLLHFTSGVRLRLPSSVPFQSNTDSALLAILWLYPPLCSRENYICLLSFNHPVVSIFYIFFSNFALPAMKPVLPLKLSSHSPSSRVMKARQNAKPKPVQALTSALLRLPDRTRPVFLLFPIFILLQGNTILFGNMSKKKNKGKEVGVERMQGVENQQK